MEVPPRLEAMQHSNMGFEEVFEIEYSSRRTYPQILRDISRAPLADPLSANPNPLAEPDQYRYELSGSIAHSWNSLLLTMRHATPSHLPDISPCLSTTRRSSPISHLSRRRGSQRAATSRNWT